MFASQYSGKKVFLTGHTGFKGSWLCEWLIELGAFVIGYSDEIRADPCLYRSLGFAGESAPNRLRHIQGDVRNATSLTAAMREADPDFVFHLAAQPIVRLSYEEPAATFDVNVMGTVNVLQAVRGLARPVTAVIVTSDKCYENREWLHSYREEDAMGGHDPYSASKGCAELVVSSFQRSFFALPEGSRIASVRAGNVIGGGDWAVDRIVPDCVRALSKGEKILVRRPRAVRPWQHVLEPLSGYLWLGAMMSSPRGRDYCQAYNFGPEIRSNRTVGDLVAEILQHWEGGWIDGETPGSPHEAGLLNLAIDRAVHHLNWRPVWGFEKTVEATALWYRDVGIDGGEALQRTKEDIEAYCSDARALNLAWAVS